MRPPASLTYKYSELIMFCGPGLILLYFSSFNVVSIPYLQFVWAVKTVCLYEICHFCIIPLASRAKLESG